MQEDAARKAALYQSPSVRSMGSCASGSSESLTSSDPGAARDARCGNFQRRRQLLFPISAHPCPASPWPPPMRAQFATLGAAKYNLASLVVCVWSLKRLLVCCKCRAAGISNGVSGIGLVNITTLSGSPGRCRMLRGGRERPPQAELPTMRSFTFLRLTPELLQPPYEQTFARFVRRMRGDAAPPSLPPADAAPNPNLGNPAPEPGAPGAGSPPARRAAGSPEPGSEGVRVLGSADMQAEAMRSYSGSGVFVANAAGEMVPVEALEAGYGSQQASQP